MLLNHCSVKVYRAFYRYCYKFVIDRYDTGDRSEVRLDHLIHNNIILSITTTKNNPTFLLFFITVPDFKNRRQFVFLYSSLSEYLRELTLLR